MLHIYDERVLHVIRTLVVKGCNFGFLAGWMGSLMSDKTVWTKWKIHTHTKSGVGLIGSNKQWELESVLSLVNSIIQHLLNILNAMLVSQPWMSVDADINAISARCGWHILSWPIFVVWRDRKAALSDIGQTGNKCQKQHCRHLLSWSVNCSYLFLKGRSPGAEWTDFNKSVYTREELLDEVWYNPIWAIFLGWYRDQNKRRLVEQSFFTGESLSCFDLAAALFQVFLMYDIKMFTFYHSPFTTGDKKVAGLLLLLLLLSFLWNKFGLRWVHNEEKMWLL